VDVWAAKRDHLLTLVVLTGARASAQPHLRTDPSVGGGSLQRRTQQSCGREDLCLRGHPQYGRERLWTLDGERARSLRLVRIARHFHRRFHLCKGFAACRCKSRLFTGDGVLPSKANEIQTALRVVVTTAGWVARAGTHVGTLRKEQCPAIVAKLPTGLGVLK